MTDCGSVICNTRGITNILEAIPPPSRKYDAMEFSPDNNDPAENELAAKDSIVPELKVDSLKFGLVFALILTAVQRIIGLVRGILFCRLLPEEQLGQWSLTWSYLMLIAPLAVLGLPGSFNRYVELYRRNGQLKAFLYRIGCISLVMTFVFSAIMYCCSSQISHWLYRDSGQVRLVTIMAAAIVVVAAFNFITSLLEALRQVRLVTIMRFVNAIGFAALALGLIFVWDNGTEAITIGFAGSCLIALVPAVWYFSRNRNLVQSSNLPLPARVHVVPGRTLRGVAVGYQPGIEPVRVIGPQHVAASGTGFAKGGAGAGWAIPQWSNHPAGFGRPGRHVGRNSDGLHDR